MKSIANMSLTFTSQIHQSITACEKNLKTQVENVEKSLENKILQSENTLTERLNHHEARMAALEAQMHQPQFPPALQNIAEASGLPMPPLPPPAARGASAARATASRESGSMHASAANARDFVARKVMIRGWCSYEEEDRLGLKSDACTAFWRLIEPHVAREYLNFLEEGGEEEFLLADRYMNRQITLLLRPSAPSNAAALLAREISRVFKEVGVRIPGRPEANELYATKDKPLGEKRRNALLKKAEVSLLPVVPAGMRLHTRWPTGALFLEGPNGASTFLGKACGETSTWVWDTAACSRIWRAPMQPVSLS
jgi:hypothetical protein